MPDASYFVPVSIFGCFQSFEIPVSPKLTVSHYILFRYNCSFFRISSCKRISYSFVLLKNYIENIILLTTIICKKKLFFIIK